MQVYLNGQMIPHSDARISVDDAGLQHGVGLFETMAATHGRVFRLQQHLDRLARSAQELGLARDLDREKLAAAVRQTLQINELSAARLRLTLTAGTVSLLKNNPGQPGSPEPTVLIVPAEPTTYDPAYFDQGIRVLIAPPGANPFDAAAGHKTLNYWPRLRTLRQAAAAGAGEAIWLNVTNHLAGGAVSNLFLIKDGSLLTPIAHGEEQPGGLPAPVLPGVTPAAVLEIAQSLDIPVERRMLSVTDLLEADEVFLTNSSWLVLPVTSVEKANIADGRVGPETRKLRAALLDLVDRQTAAD